MPTKTLALTGVILILLQLSGIPGIWKSFFAIVAGVLIVILSFRISNNKNFTDKPQDNNEQSNLSKEKLVTMEEIEKSVDVGEIKELVENKK